MLLFAEPVERLFACASRRSSFSRTTINAGADPKLPATASRGGKRPAFTMLARAGSGEP